MRGLAPTRVGGGFFTMSGAGASSSFDPTPLPSIAASVVTEAFVAEHRIAV